MINLRHLKLFKANPDPNLNPDPNPNYDANPNHKPARTSI